MMVGAWLLVLVMATGPVNDALERGVACYEALDYACAETALAEALAVPLDREKAVRARHYQALVSLANRDEPAARRAVRALLVLDPEFAPGRQAPPRLRAIVDETRQRDVDPRIAPVARVDATSIRVFGADAERWTEGLGVEVAGGVDFDGRWRLELSAAYGDHRPKTFTLEGLGLLSLGAAALRSFSVGPLRVAVGVGAGATRVAIDGVTGDETYWGGHTIAPVDVALPLGAGFSVGVRTGPMVLAVEDDGRAAFSLLLPIAGGLRYGR